MAFDQKSTTGRIAIAAAEHVGLVGILVFLVVVAIGYLFLFAPAIRQIHGANRSAALQLERTAKEKYLTELNALAQSYAQIPSADIERIQAMIPSADRLPELLVTFEEIGRNTDVAVTSVGFTGGLGEQPASAKAAAGLAGLVPITINLALEHADYQRFKLFLEALERHLRVFDIASMSLNPSGAQYALTLKTYVHPPLTK